MTEVRTRRLWIAPAAILIMTAALVQVRIVEPRIHVRWSDAVTSAERTTLEDRYGLADGQPLDGTTWRYELRDRSRENVGALVEDPAVADTAYVDRPRLTVPDREIQVDVTRWRTLVGPAPWRAVQLQSLLLFAFGGVMLSAAALQDRFRRQLTAGAALLGVVVSAYALPLRQPLRMGDADTYTESRDSFESFSGTRQIRSEAHLSHAILGRLDAIFGRNDTSPARALAALMRAATAGFFIAAIVVAIVERWSPVALRYLGLVLLAPATLLYFGYRELGHLSLNAAAFPLLVRGLRQGTVHLEASGALLGLGAALHGFGLLSLAGAWLATLAAPLRSAERLRLFARLAVWGTALYVGWMAVYLIVLKLPIVPGHAEAIPLRPWFVDEVSDRVNVAIFSATGGRDLFFSAWVAGVPLLAVAASMWRTHADAARMALVYSIPSTVFLLLFWPIQGLAAEMDLIFAAFPALFALAWVCAHDVRRTMIAAAMLASAQLAFWRVVLDHTFLNSRI